MKVKVVKWCQKKWNEHNLMYVCHKQYEIMHNIQRNVKASVWKNFNLARTGSSNYNAGHLRGDRWLATRTSRKKKFPKNSRKKVVLEWEKEIAIMHMYPIQTVGSSCPTFPASAAKKKQCFHHFFTTSLPDKHSLPWKRVHPEIFVQEV